MRITKPKGLPNPLTLMLLVIIVAAIGTWLLPAGQYSKLAPNNNKAFIITSTSDAVSLPFTQQTLDSLSSTHYCLTYFKRHFFNNRDKILNQ